MQKYESAIKMITSQSFTSTKIISLFLDTDEGKKCEDKETWCETSKPKCVDEIKEICPKYCGICKGMNQPSKQ